MITQAAGLPASEYSLISRIITCGRVKNVLYGGVAVALSGFAYRRAALSSAQASSATVASQVAASSQQKLCGATPEAIAAHPGWQSSSALQACLTAWEQRAAQLASQVQQVSDHLGTTIENYDTAENQVVGDIRAAAAGLKTAPDSGKGSQGR
jgi:hypothetical protein